MLGIKLSLSCKHRDLYRKVAFGGLFLALCPWDLDANEVGIFRFTPGARQETF